MIEEERPDLVHIVTWPSIRVEPMRLVSDLGVPACTVEKPVCVGVRDYVELMSLARSTRTRFAACHQFRWHENLTRVRSGLESGRLGGLRFLSGSSRMNVSGQGTHVLDYMMSLNGDAPVSAVFGTASGGSGLSGSHPAPDSIAAALTFDNGVRGCWIHGTLAPSCGAVEHEWEHVRVEGFAEHGRAQWEEFGDWVIAGPQGVERGEAGPHETYLDRRIRAQAAFHESMLIWLEGGPAPGTNLTNALHQWKVVLGLYASALWRRPVEIERLEPPIDLVESLTEALVEMPKV